mmetsp:Transcript_35664/g.49512  ORF Transcript_35664/g.49512 Transcript_35664/m.49512 type:complete len:225 (-) Transcript_35664:442-1116(-)
MEHIESYKGLLRHYKVLSVSNKESSPFSKDVMYSVLGTSLRCTICANASSFISSSSSKRSRQNWAYSAHKSLSIEFTTKFKRYNSNSTDGEKSSTQRHNRSHPRCMLFLSGFSVKCLQICTNISSRRLPTALPFSRMARAEAAGYVVRRTPQKASRHLFTFTAILDVWVGRSIRELGTASLELWNMVSIHFLRLRILPLANCSRVRRREYLSKRQRGFWEISRI